MIARKVSDGINPCAQTWDLAADTLSVAFVAVGPRYATVSGPLW